MVVCDIKKNCSTKITQFCFKVVLSLLILAFLFFLVNFRIMSKRKTPGIIYEDAIQNILAFVKNDDIEDELDPRFEN